MKKHHDARTIHSETASKRGTGEMRRSHGHGDLARLRIERNRAMKHARGAIARFTFL